MSKKLKPCPFCGGEAELYGEEMDYGVRCKDEDNCEGKVDHFATERLAVKAWNRRVEVEDE